MNLLCAEYISKYINMTDTFNLINVKIVFCKWSLHDRIFMNCNNPFTNYYFIKKIYNYDNKDNLDKYCLKYISYKTDLNQFIIPSIKVVEYLKVLEIKNSCNVQKIQDMLKIIYKYVNLQTLNLVLYLVLLYNLHHLSQLHLLRILLGLLLNCLNPLQNKQLLL